LGRENYIFAAAEKTQPYQFALYALGDDKINFARDRFKMALTLIKFCREHNHWPSHNEFEVLKNSYELGALDEYFETIEKSELITILQ